MNITLEAAQVTKHEGNDFFGEKSFARGSWLKPLPPPSGRMVEVTDAAWKMQMQGGWDAPLCQL